MKNIASFIILFLTFFISSCKKETPAPYVKTGVELVAIGAINFGGLVVGEKRDAAIRIYNYGPNSVNTNNIQTLLSEPFSIKSVGEPCNSGSLPANRNCVISVQFKPTIQGVFTQNFTIEGKDLLVSGRGMLDGVMSISDSSWNLGTITAGSELRKTINVSNNGDFTIQTPLLNLPSEITVGLNTCGAYITPQKTCVIELISRKTIAMNYENVSIDFIQPNQTLSISYSANVLPAEPAGLIEFINPPSTIIADGLTELLLESAPIKDKYGNIVLDGTTVNFTPINLNLLSGNSATTVGGKVGFHLRATATRGQSVLTLTSSEAVGVLRLRAVAGDPYGTISLQSFDPNVIANGQNVVSLISNGIFDANGNIVEDGTIVYHELIGAGTLNAPFSQVILGRISLSITSPLYKGPATLKLKSGPIYDENGNIVDWKAQGVYTINWISGVPASPIPIVSNESGIYADEDFTAEEQGLPIRTQVVIGPIKDANGNIVAENTPITLTAINGKLLYVSTNPYLYYTDANGYIYAVVAGNGTRGKIQIKAEHDKGAVGIHEIWAFRQENILYSNGPDNKLFLYEKYYNAQLLPPINEPWAKSVDYFGIQYSDNNTQMGVNAVIFELYNSNTAQLWLDNLSFVLNDCYFSAKNYIVLGPCHKNKEVIDEGPYAYDALSLFNPSQINNFGIDYPLNSIHNTRSNQDYCNFYNQGTISNGDITPKKNGCNDEMATGRYCRWDETVYNQNFQMFGYCVSRPIQNAGYSYNERYDQLLVHGGNTQRLIYQDINQNSFVNLMDEFYNYSTIFNNITQFGVASVSTKQNGDEEFEEVGSYPYNKKGMMSFTQKDNFSFGIGGYEQTLNCNYFATQGLCDNGTAGFCSWDTTINACKNLGPQTLSMDALEITVFNHGNKQWSSILPDPDPNEYYDTATPTERYQHEFIYSPTDNSLYLIGGLRKYQCSEFKSQTLCSNFGEINNRCTWNPSELECQARPNMSDKGWIQGNEIGKTDIWKVSLDQITVDGSGSATWKRLCGSQKTTKLNGEPNSANVPCNINTVYNDLDKYPSNFEKKTTAIWNDNRQKMYVTISGENVMYELNLTTGTLSQTNDGSAQLAGAYQLLYNKKTQRTFGYFRNTINSINSNIKVWDMNPNETKYYRTRFLIGAGSKNVAYEATPIITAFGYTTNSITPNANGIIAYIYNHDDNLWEYMDDNDATTLSQAQAQVLAKNYNRTNYINKYISNDGYMDILIAPKGQSQNNSKTSIIIDQIKLEGKF